MNVLFRRLCCYADTSAATAVDSNFTGLMLVERMLHNTGKREGKVMSCQHFHMESAINQSINQSSNRLEIRSNLANCSRQHTTTAKRVYCICDRSFCSIRFDEMSVKRRDTNAHVSCGGTRWEDFIFTASSESLTQIAKHRPSSNERTPVSFEIPA